MTADIILKYYWDIFLAHVCEFYPLDKSFIERYQYELDWKSLSKSKVIEWDIEFLKKYEGRFLWHELAWNDSILWTEDKIDHFKKRLDWYYLGRNKNLPITDEFIQKYAKKLTVVENNPLLSDILVKKYNIKVLPANQRDTQEIKNISEDEVETLLNTFRFYDNQINVYQIVFKPIIDTKKGIEHIFNDKFDYSQRYYFLEPIEKDISGLTPEFGIDGPNPFNNCTDDRGLLYINKELTLVNGSLQEGPDRLYEVPRFSSFSYFTTLLVSENVKSILDQFKLPRHIYHPVKLRPKKLTTTTKYFLLQLEHDTLVKDMKFSTQEYFYTFKDFDIRGFGIIEEKISSYQKYLDVKKSCDEKHADLSYGTTLYPNCFELQSDFDMYSYSVHGEFIINQYLKDALEKYFPDQMAFKSAQLLNIKMDQDKYSRKSGQTINTKLSSKLIYQESSEDKYYFSKAERLEKADPAFNKDKQENDAFSKKEIELNVVFPQIFKNNYLRKSIKIDGYMLLPVSKFYIQNAYSARYPETYKSVAFAENGLGDSLNLILERDSDYKLQPRLFEFLHETGEYEER